MNNNKNRKPTFEIKKLNEDFNIHRQLMQRIKKVKNIEEVSVNHTRSNTLGNCDYLYPKLTKLKYVRCLLII